MDEDIMEKLKNAISIIGYIPTIRELSIVLLRALHEGKIVVFKDFTSPFNTSPIAFTDGDKIYVREDVVKNFKSGELAFTLLHELFHIIYKHTSIWKFKYPMIANIATDVFVNRLIDEYSVRITPAGGEERPLSYDRHKYVFPESVNDFIKDMLDQIAKGIDKPECINMIEEFIKKLPERDWWMQADVGEMYGLIVSIIHKLKAMKCIEEVEVVIKDGNLGDILPPGTVKVENGGICIDKDKLDRYKRGEIDVGKETDERYKYWDRNVKTAGFGKGFVTDLFIKLHKPKIDWRKFLRDVVMRRKTSVISTWRKINRRLPYLVPGTTFLGTPRVVAIIDVSGSISDEEYNDFVSEINKIVELTKGNLYVILFSVGVVDEISKSRIRVEDVINKIKTVPHGGTVIGDALKRAIEILKKDDVVVVFTDGYIYDESDPDTKLYAETLMSKAYVTIDIYTGTVAECFKNWININYYEDRV